MLRSDFGSALVSGAQKSGALELVGNNDEKATFQDLYKIFFANLQI